METRPRVHHDKDAVTRSAARAESQLLVAVSSAHGRVSARGRELPSVRHRHEAPSRCARSYCPNRWKTEQRLQATGSARHDGTRQ